MGRNPVLIWLIIIRWLMLEVTVLEGLATNPMDEILSRSKIQALLVNSFHIKIKLLKICPLRKFPDISSNK